MVSLLLAAGADVGSRDKDGNTALQLAANSGHTRCVELLLLGNALVDQVSPQGLRALHLAACGGHEAVVKALIRKGARLGCTALEVDNGTYCLPAHGNSCARERGVRGWRWGSEESLKGSRRQAPHTRSIYSPSNLMYIQPDVFYKQGWSARGTLPGPTTIRRFTGLSRMGTRWRRTRCSRQCLHRTATCSC